MTWLHSFFRGLATSRLPRPPHLPLPASCRLTLELRPLEQASGWLLVQFWGVMERGLQVWVRTSPRVLRHKRTLKKGSHVTVCHPECRNPPGWASGFWWVAKQLSSPLVSPAATHPLTQHWSQHSAWIPDPEDLVWVFCFFFSPPMKFGLFWEMLQVSDKCTDRAHNASTRKGHFRSVQSWSFHLLIHTWVCDWDFFLVCPLAPYWGAFYTFRGNYSGTVMKWKVFTNLSVVTLFLRAVVFRMFNDLISHS